MVEPLAADGQPSMVSPWLVSADVGTTPAAISGGGGGGGGTATILRKSVITTQL